MRRVMWLALAGSALAAWGAVRAPAQAQKPAPKGSTIVDIDGLKSATPDDWRREKPANLLRTYQFRLDRHKDDAEDAEVSILRDISGDANQNMARWKKSFVIPEDKKLDEVGKVEKTKVGKAELVILDMQGTYLWKERPQAPDETAKLKPNYRMIAVFFETGDGTHKIQLVGPAKTVEMYKPGFDKWLRSFK